MIKNNQIIIRKHVNNRHIISIMLRKLKNFQVIEINVIL